MVVGLSLLNRDGLTKALNNDATSKVFAYLGGLSLYVYMLHYPVAIFVLRLMGPNSAEAPYTFWQIFIPTVLISVVLSILVKYVMENFILKKD